MQLPHFGAPSEIFTQPKKKIMKRWLLQGKYNFPTKTGSSYYLKISRFVLLLIFSFLFGSVFSQQRVTGKVLSGDTAVAGATVQVKNTKTATQTDTEGNFTINAPAKSTLVISSVGFATQEVKVGDRANIAIQLESVAREIESVVVVGYGTQKKST